jgi:hypothetical protein
MSGLQASSSDFFLKEGGQYHELGCCDRGIFLWALVDTPWLRESLSLCICWQLLKVVSKKVSVDTCHPFWQTVALSTQLPVGSPDGPTFSTARVVRKRHWDLGRPDLKKAGGI